MILMVIDITFVYERPQAITIWFSVTGTSMLVAKALLPFSINLGTAWKPFYWAWSLVSGIALALVFLVVRETYFFRPPVTVDGKVLVQGGGERIRMYDTWEDLPDGENESSLPQHSSTQNWLGQRKISSAGGNWRSALACFPQILLCLVNPLIFWVALLNAVNFAAFTSLSMTSPVILGQAPYHLSTTSISLVNLGGAAGTMLAWPASKTLTSGVSSRLGVRHAEHMLPGLILPVLAGASGALLFGLAAEYHWHYVLIHLAFGLNAFSFCGMSIANTLWITEVFPQFTAAALAAVGGVSYIASFGLSAALRPWLAAQGYAWVNGFIGLALLTLGFIAVPIALWGKSIRQYIAGRWAAFEGGALRPQ
jgi:hypothetical protein